MHAGALRARVKFFLNPLHPDPCEHRHVHMQMCMCRRPLGMVLNLPFFFKTSIYLVGEEQDHPTVPTWRRSKDTLQGSVLSVYHASSNEFQGAAISAPPWHWARSQPRPDWTDLHGCWGCKLKSKWHRLSLLATFPVPSRVSNTVIRALQIGTWRGLAFHVAFPRKALPLQTSGGRVVMKMRVPASS